MAIYEKKLRGVSGKIMTGFLVLVGFLAVFFAVSKSRGPATDSLSGSSDNNTVYADVPSSYSQSTYYGQAGYYSESAYYSETSYGSADSSGAGK